MRGMNRSFCSFVQVAVNEGDFEQAWEHATAICPLAMNAVMRVKSPSAISAPHTSSIGPAVQMIDFGAPGGIPPNRPKTFCAP